MATIRQQIADVSELPLTRWETWETNNPSAGHETGNDAEVFFGQPPCIFCAATSLFFARPSCIFARPASIFCSATSHFWLGHLTFFGPAPCIFSQPVYIFCSAFLHFCSGILHFLAGRLVSGIFCSLAGRTSSWVVGGPKKTSNINNNTKTKPSITKIEYRP